MYEYYIYIYMYPSCFRLKCCEASLSHYTLLTVKLSCLTDKDKKERVYPSLHGSKGLHWNKAMASIRQW